MGPVDPTPIALWPLAAWFANWTNLPNQWRLLIVPAGQESEIALMMVEELGSLVDSPVAHLVVHSSDEVFRGVLCSEHLVISGFDHLDPHAWRAVDIGRSRLRRDPSTLLIVAKREAEQISKFAPKLWSWLSSEIWTFEPEGGLDRGAS